MQLILYTNFSKKKNSTKQPTGGTTHNVHIKNGCSIESPIFLIDGIDLNVNYAKWNDSYYFVIDIILMNNNIYEIHCEMDPLATWKSTIGNSTQFVERSASNYDSFINDEQLSSTQSIVNISTASTDWVGLGSVGCYIMRTVSVTGLHMYASNNLSIFAQLYLQAFTPDPESAQQVEEYGVLATTLGKKGLAMLNITDYLGGISWVPFTASLLGTEVSYFDIGVYGELIEVPSGQHVYEISNAARESLFELNLPSNSYSDFRKFSPKYSQYSISFPGIGTVSLDPMLTMDSINLAVAMNVDLYTGAVNYRLYGNSHEQIGRIVAEYNGQIGYQVPIGQMDANGANLITSVVGTAAGVAGGIVTGGTAGIVAAVTAGVAGTFNAVQTIMTPTTNINGGNGNRAAALTAIRTTVINYGSKDFAVEKIGRPLCQNKVINTLTGFIKCAGASLDVSGVSVEKDVINNYLNGGFYYE